MRRKLVILVLPVAMMAAACTGGGDDAAAETSAPSTTAVVTTTPAPTTTTTRPATTTTRPPTTTTTTTTEPPFIWDGDPAAMTSPLDHVSSFRFSLAMFDVTEDGFDGPVFEGVFAAPDGVTCTVSNPAFLAPTIGTWIASGDSAWFDDSFHEADEQPRSDESVIDGLIVCPGATEFWTAPFWTSDLMELTNTGSRDVLDEVALTLVDIDGVDDLPGRLVGQMWVTEQGWPVRVEIDGAIPGGVSSLLDPGDDEGAGAEDVEPIEVSIELELTDIDSPSIAVRSPRGVIVAGPFGEIVPAVEREAELPVDVARAAAEARTTDCFFQEVMPFLVGDATLEELALDKVWSMDRLAGDDGEDLGNVTISSPGLPASPNRLMATDAEGETRVRHVEVYLRHIAPVVAFASWTGAIPTGWADSDDLMVVVETRSGDKIVSWDGFTLTWAEETALTGFAPSLTHELSFHGIMPTRPQETVLTEDNAQIAWEWMDRWVGDVESTFDGLRAGDLQALADFEALYGERHVARSVGCALVAYGFVATNEAFDAEAPFGEVVESIAHEIAGQNALVFNEYVEVLGSHLEQTDWLMSDDIDLRVPLLAGPTDGRFIAFFTNAAASLVPVSNPDDLLDAFGFR